MKNKAKTGLFLCYGSICSQNIWKYFSLSTWNMISQNICKATQTSTVTPGQTEKSTGWDSLPVL